MEPVRVPTCRAARELALDGDLSYTPHVKHLGYTRVNKPCENGTTAPHEHNRMLAEVQDRLFQQGGVISLRVRLPYVGKSPLGGFLFSLGPYTIQDSKSQIEDGAESLESPAHAGLFESLTDDVFASGLDHAAADE